MNQALVPTLNRVGLVVVLVVVSDALVNAHPSIQEGRIYGC